MGGVSIWHWVVVGVVVMLLFGRGKISELMGDMAKGIKAFKKGMSDDESAPTAPLNPAASTTPVDPVRTLEHRGPETPAPAATTSSAFADRKVG